MGKETCHRQVGYQQGFEDGKVTKGKINKKYLERLFTSETQNLSNQESILYKTGWQDGFIDAVRGAVQNTVREEDCIIKHLDKIYGIGR